jgi:hypothetical protein
MKHFIFILTLLFACFINTVYSQDVSNKEQPTLNLFEYGGVLTSEDNLKNLFRNFPLYVENGSEIDFLSYEFIGTIKNKRDAKKYVKNNFDDFISLGWMTLFYKDTTDIHRNSPPSSMQFFIDTDLADKSTFNKKIKTLSEEYIYVGDQVFAINFILDLQKHTHYIFIHPKTNKVLMKGNIFAIKFPISHIVDINNRKARQD